MKRARAILLGLVIASLAFPSTAWSVTTTEGTDGTNGTSGTPMLDANNDRTFCSQAARGAVVNLPGGSIIMLNACSTSTIVATDIGSTGTGTGIVPVTGTDGKINVAIVPDQSGNIAGTTGYFPKWTSSNQLGLSTLFESGNQLTRQYAGNNVVDLESYTTSTGSSPIILLKHSLSNTLGTKAETTNGTVLGSILFAGVHSAGNFASGAVMSAIQAGTAGSSYVPTRLRLYASSASGTLDGQLDLNPDNSVSMSGPVSASNITATPAASAIVQAKTDHKVDVGWLPVGTTAGTVAAGDDSRITGAVAGSGTAKYLPEWTGAGALGNSQVSDVSGTTVVNPAAASRIGLVVRGDTNGSGSIQQWALTDGSLKSYIDPAGDFVHGYFRLATDHIQMNGYPTYLAWGNGQVIEDNGGGGLNMGSYYSLSLNADQLGVVPTGVIDFRINGTNAVRVEHDKSVSFANGLKLNGATSGTVTHGVAATTASYSLIDPSTAPGAGQAIVYPSGGGQGAWADIAADPSASLTTGVVPKKGASTLVDSTITDNATSGPAMPSVGMTGGLGTSQTTLLPGFAATGLGQTSRNWAAMTTLGTNVYAAVGPGDIYMQTGGTGNFVALGQTSRGWTAMTTLGNNVYAAVANGDIYVQTNGTGNFVALGQTSRVWRGMATFGNNVYASASGTGPDIYMQTGGTGNFVALSQATGGWGVMTASPSGVYATNTTTGSIYVQTNGTGAFNILAGTSGSWAAMAAIGNDVYAEIAGSTGGVYIQRGGVGGFVPVMITTNRAWAAMTSSAGKLYGAVQPGDIYTFSASSMDFRLPSDNGVAGQVLSTDGTSGVKKWVSVNTSTATGTSTFTASNAHGVDVQNGLVYATHALVSTDITTPLGYTPLAPNGLSNTCTKPTFVNGQATGCASVTTGDIGAVSIAEVRTKYAYKANLTSDYSVSAGAGFTTIISTSVDMSLGDIFITASVSGIGSNSGNDCLLLLTVGGGHASVSGGSARVRIPGNGAPISTGLTAYYSSTASTYTVALTMASSTSGSCQVNAGSDAYQSATMFIYQRSNG